MSQFKKFFSALKRKFIPTLIMLSLAGCLQPGAKPQPPAEIKKITAAKRMNERLKLSAKQLRRKRISTEKNRYEGSLWRYESSFGNLLRDHRARFRGDLLSINEMGMIVNVPPPKIAPEGQPSGGAETGSAALEALTL